MKDKTERTWLEISLSAIGENYRRIKNYIGQNCEVIGVIKADAYGLGADVIGPYLEKCGCRLFAVADMEEALTLRDAGLASPIMTLSPVPAKRVKEAVENGIESIAVGISQARELSGAAEKAGVRIGVHIKADSGLARFGIWIGDDPRAAADEILSIAKLPGLAARSIMTHYTGCGPEGDYFNRMQMKRFSDVCDIVLAERPELKRHEASSHFTMQYPECHHDSVRVASILFGMEGPTEKGPEMLPAVTLKTRIVQIKELPCGVPVGYGPTYYTNKPTKIAIVPIGYADGLRRTIQNKYFFIASGKPAGIIGKISMDYTTLDITGIEINEGDAVTVIGSEGGCSSEVWHMADAYGATVGEVTTVLNKRIPRLYK